MAVHDVVERARGDVRQREKGDAGISFVEAELGGSKVLVSGNVAMGEHDALGLAGGTGGVDKRGEIVGLDGADQRIEDGIAVRAGIVGASKELGECDGAVRGAGRPS